MKKNKTMTLLTATCITLLSSCAGSDIVQTEDVPVDENEQNKVCFMSDNNLQGLITRLTGTTWDDYDLIGASMLDESGSTVLNGYYNLYYNALKSGQTTYFISQSTDMYFKSGNTNVTFVAYYPRNNTPESIELHTGDYPVDMICAKAVGNGSVSRNVKLDFKYITAKVVIKLIRGGGDFIDLTYKDAVITNAIYHGYFNAIKGEITNDDTPGDTGGFKTTGNTNEYYALFVPQTTPDNCKIVISINSGTVTLDFSNKVLEAGKLYTYNVTVTNNMATLENASITERVVEPAVNQGVEMQL